MWTFLGILGALVFLVLLWLGLSIKIVGPTERGILVIFGRVVTVVANGPCFVPFLVPGTKLVRYPTKQYRLDYVARPVVTAQEEYPEGSGTIHDRAQLNVDTTVYFTWPSVPQDLIRAFRTAPPPGLAQVIFEHYEDAVVGATRAVCGRMAWAEVAGDRDEVKRRVLDRLRAQGSPFQAAGITDIEVVIEEIGLPDRLRQLMIRPEEAEFERRQKEQDALGEAAQIQRRGEAYRVLGILGRLFAPFLALQDRGR